MLRNGSCIERRGGVVGRLCSRGGKQRGNSQTERDAAIVARIRRRVMRQRERLWRYEESVIC